MTRRKYAPLHLQMLERAAPSGAFLVSSQFNCAPPMLPQSEWASFIKRRAAELGFMACGISKAEFLEEEAPRLETWLTRR